MGHIEAVQLVPLTSMSRTMRQEFVLGANAALGDDTLVGTRASEDHKADTGGAVYHSMCPGS